MMRRMFIGYVGWLLCGCEQDQFQRGYVISQSHFEEEAETPETDDSDACFTIP